LNWLRANTREILGRVDEAGHGTKRLQTDRLLSISIDVPPLAEQMRVASILGAYDDLVENFERRVQLLEQMKSEVYREWCSSETPAERRQALLQLSNSDRLGPLR
jgi:type I restriction enzyme S subunit